MIGLEMCTLCLKLLHHSREESCHSRLRGWVEGRLGRRVLWRVLRLRGSVVWVEVRRSVRSPRPGVVDGDVSRSLWSWMAN